MRLSTVLLAVALAVAPLAAAAQSGGPTGPTIVTVSGAKVTPNRPAFDKFRDKLAGSKDLDSTRPSSRGGSPRVLRPSLRSPPSPDLELSTAARPVDPPVKPEDVFGDDAPPIIAIRGRGAWQKRRTSPARTSSSGSP